jgi:SAM-dependent methyltransferase
MRTVDLRESWNRLSKHYQNQFQLETHAAHYGPFAPNENQLRLLGSVEGKRILELGCGGGQCSIAFAKEGAGCVAVDLSDAQIEYARHLAEVEGVSIAFHRGEMLAFLETQPDAAYDIVFSAYAFQYVEALSSVFQHAYRLLRPEGLFVFSLDHPINDVTRNEAERVVFGRSYFERGRMEWDWEHGQNGERSPFYSFHRTVGDFLNLLADAGFRVERLLEPEPTNEHDPWGAVYNYQRHATIPATIIWKARKGG